MRFKLDENLDDRVVGLLAQGGHDVETVRTEGLSGYPDDAIYAACLAERRVLVTLDLDFSNPFRFPPARTEGILIVRPPRPLFPMIRATLEAALPELEGRPLVGRLWIVEPGRLRVYEPEELTGPGS